MGKTGDPADGAAVASTIFAAVVVYGVRRVHRSFLFRPVQLTRFTLQVFLIFCGLQAYLHVRNSRRGQISLR
jgi:ribonuclease kappa